ncbi:unnamed protein product, partial [Darwinula stevensoni]
MNIYRLSGDLTHLLALVILLVKIWKSRSCAGECLHDFRVSGRSQVLFAMVYTTRFLDLFTNFVSVYNSVMKVVFIAITFVTVYLIYVKFKDSYDSDHDTFSIYLESVAILPQLTMVCKTGEADGTMSLYLLTLGSYRAWYILNWMYRYYFEGFFDPIAVVAGVVQTIDVGCTYIVVEWSISKRADEEDETQFDDVEKLACPLIPGSLDQLKFA